VLVDPAHEYAQARKYPAGLFEVEPDPQVPDGQNKLTFCVMYSDPYDPQFITAHRLDQPGGW